MKSYTLNGSESRLDSTMVRVVLAIISFMVGVLIALWAISAYIGKYGVVEAVGVSSWCGLDNSNACEVLADNSYWINVVPEGLAVGDNYAEQKTANVHVLEPKVSDVYYQYASFDERMTGRTVVN